MNNGQQAFRRLVVQLRSGGGGGGGGGPSGKGMFAGGGLLAVLVGGAFVVNSSLFNGECSFRFIVRFRCALASVSLC